MFFWLVLMHICLVWKNLEIICLLQYEIVIDEFEILQVQGIVQDRNGNTVATIIGKWDESIHYLTGDFSEKFKGSEPLSEAHLLWKCSKPPLHPTRYNLTRFAITLNELTPGLKVTGLIYFCHIHLIRQEVPAGVELIFMFPFLFTSII